MKAIETTGTINHEGQLTLDLPLNTVRDQRVRVIVLIAEDEEPEDTSSASALGDTLYEDSTETVIAGIREGWQQALKGDVRPISELWSSLDAE
jgi:hypothetical protein